MFPTRWRPQAITLDLDDTLWPIGPTLVAAEQTLSDWLHRQAPATAAAYGADTRAAIRRRVLAAHPDQAHDLGFLRLEGLRLALADAGDDPALADEGFAIFLAARQRVSLFDDVLPVLARWASRYPLVAVSNGNADLQATGLASYFLGAVSAHQFGYAKPDPRIFHAACRMAGTEPGQVLHIGDDPHLDVQGAHDAGLRAAWILRPGIAERHARGAPAPSAPAFDTLLAVEAWLDETT